MNQLCFRPPPKWLHYDLKKYFAMNEMVLSRHNNNLVKITNHSTAALQECLAVKLAHVDLHSIILQLIDVKHDWPMKISSGCMKLNRCSSAEGILDKNRFASYQRFLSDLFYSDIFYCSRNNFLWLCCASLILEYHFFGPAMVVKWQFQLITMMTPFCMDKCISYHVRLSIRRKKSILTL